MTRTLDPAGLVGTVLDGQVFAPRAAICGGSLARAAVGAPAGKDLDLFVWGEDAQRHADELIGAVLKGAGWRRAFPREAGSHGGRPVYVHPDHTIAIDLVVLPRKRTVEEVLAGFDLDVSRVWFDGRLSYALPSTWMALSRRRGTVDEEIRNAGTPARVARYRSFGINFPDEVVS